MKKLMISASLPRSASPSSLSRTSGIPIPTTNSVMAIANTASLKNATRSNSRLLSLRSYRASSLSRLPDQSVTAGVSRSSGRGNQRQPVSVRGILRAPEPRRILEPRPQELGDECHDRAALWPAGVRREVVGTVDRHEPLRRRGIVVEPLAQRPRVDRVGGALQQQHRRRAGGGPGAAGLTLVTREDHRRADPTVEAARVARDASRGVAAVGVPDDADLDRGDVA